MKEIFKTVVEPLISLPKWCFSIQTTLICVYHIILKEDAEKVLKSPSFYPPISKAGLKRYAVYRVPPPGF